MKLLTKCHNVGILATIRDTKHPHPLTIHHPTTKYQPHLANNQVVTSVNISAAIREQPATATDNHHHAATTTVSHNQWPPLSTFTGHLH